MPEVFNFLKEKGNLETLEMMNIFNMGIGFMLIIEEKDKDKALEILGENAHVIGTITSQTGIHFD